MPPLGAPLAQYSTEFNLAAASTVGFFGGNEAVEAMATVHLYERRRWLGWYNAPGSSKVAKKFRRLANSRFWDALFPGPSNLPAVVLGLDDKKGPRYIAALSGTALQTGHLGYLTMERNKEVTVIEIEGRVSTTFNITYLAMKNVDYNAPVKLLPFNSALLALIPITISVATCVMCALVYDWFSFSVILAGIITNGLTSVVIGGGRLVIRSVKQTSTGALPDHGILIGEDGIMVIKGAERDMNVITRGRFELGMAKDTDKDYTYTGKYRADILFCLLLLVPACQLFLIPLGTLFGQIMFLFSLGVSWVYNFYLSSSLEKEKIQTSILFETLGNPEMRRFRAGTRTTMAVFVCLLLFHGVELLSLEVDRENRDKILKSCIPNDTDVWRWWRKKVVDQMLDIDGGSNSSPVRDEGDLKLPESDKELLKLLLEDAQAAFRGYQRIRDNLPVDSSPLQAALFSNSNGLTDQFSL